MQTYAKALGLTLAGDWVVAAACAKGTLPLWMFLAFNVPFGAAYVWLESRWTGTQYLVNGQPVSDTVSLALFLGVVLAQAAVYAAVWRWWRGRGKSSDEL